MQVPPVRAPGGRCDVDAPATALAGEIAKLQGRLDHLLSAVARPDIWANGAPPDAVRAFLEAMPEMFERITLETTALAAANGLSDQGWDGPPTLRRSPAGTRLARDPGHDYRSGRHLDADRRGQHRQPRLRRILRAAVGGDEAVGDQRNGACLGPAPDRATLHPGNRLGRALRLRGPDPALRQRLPLVSGAWAPLRETQGGASSVGACC